MSGAACPHTFRDLAGYGNPRRLARLVPGRGVGKMRQGSDQLAARSSTRARWWGAIAVFICVTGALLLAGCGTSSVHSTRTNILEPPGSRVGTTPPGFASTFVYRVPSGSMEPTVRIGAKVNVRRGAAPAVGAIVVFHPPEGFAQQQCGPKPHSIEPGAAACDTPIPHKALIELLKRIVAGPGDEIYIWEGHVYRKAPGSHDFVREQDSYARRCGRARECQFPVRIRIPAGSWFLMGDNRRESDDSRFWGPVPRSWIAGVASHAKAQPIMEREKPKGSKQQPRAPVSPRASRAPLRTRKHTRIIGTPRLSRV